MGFRKVLGASAFGNRSKTIPRISNSSGTWSGCSLPFRWGITWWMSGWVQFANKVPLSIWFYLVQLRFLGIAWMTVNPFNLGNLALLIRWSRLRGVRMKKVRSPEVRKLKKIKIEMNIGLDLSRGSKKWQRSRDLTKNIEWWILNFEYWTTDTENATENRYRTTEMPQNYLKISRPKP